MVLSLMLGIPSFRLALLEAVLWTRSYQDVCISNLLLCSARSGRVHRTVKRPEDQQDDERVTSKRKRNVSSSITHLFGTFLSVGRENYPHQPFSTIFSDYDDT